jgi:hypothetical protein|tara:strand:+ start:21563 stop:21730 length:168 start_codon:yes stop_codon:yes gene_type:complete
MFDILDIMKRIEELRVEVTEIERQATLKGFATPNDMEALEIISTEVETLKGCVHE